jgi:hypothetical protein
MFCVRPGVAGESLKSVSDPSCGEHFTLWKVSESRLYSNRSVGVRVFPLHTHNLAVLRRWRKSEKNKTKTEKTAEREERALDTPTWFTSVRESLFFACRTASLPSVYKTYMTLDRSEWAQASPRVSSFHHRLFWFPPFFHSLLIFSDSIACCFCCFFTHELAHGERTTLKAIPSRWSSLPTAFLFSSSALRKM